MATVSTQYFLGDTEIITSYLGNESILFNPLEIGGYIPTGGLIVYLDGTQNVDTASGYWYNSYGENITASLFGSPTWDSNTGVLSFTHQQGLETIPKPGALQISQSQFTIIYSGRYIGDATDKHGRILTSLVPDGVNRVSIDYNWTLGNYSGSYSGSSQTGPGWYAPAIPQWVSQPSGSYDTNWRVFGGWGNWLNPNNISGSFYLNGDFVNFETTPISYSPDNIGPYGLGINTGSYTDGVVGGVTLENSNCEVADILVYNRILTDVEIQQTSLFLANRVGI